MYINRSRLLGLLCVLATLSSYGCDDKDVRNDRIAPIGPSRISFNGIGQTPVNPFDISGGAMAVQPAVAVPQPIAGARCPTRQPFQVPFSILGTGRGRSDLFVNEVQMRFVDRAGVVGGTMTMARTQLADRFGSTELPAVGTRSFPLSLAFGCLGRPVGTLEVVVLTGDSRTHDMRTSLSIDVR
jgi:hypothetical protein